MQIFVVLNSYFEITSTNSSSQSQFWISQLNMYFQLCFQSYILICRIQLEFYAHRKYKIEVFTLLLQEHLQR